MEDEEFGSYDSELFRILNEGPAGERLRHVWHSLSMEERDVLNYRFGLEDGKTKTVRQIARIFGKRPRMIRKIEEEALRKIRKPLG